MDHLLNGLVDVCVFSGADQFSKLEAADDNNPTNLYESECHSRVLGIFHSKSTLLTYYPPTGKLGHFSQLNDLKCSTSPSPLPPEMINSLTVFLYPDGFYVFGYQHSLPQPSLHQLILTGIEGDHYYCVNAAFFRRFFAKRLPDSSQLGYDLTLITSSEQRDNKSIEIILQLNVTLISRVPLFQTLKECLSSILPELLTSPDIYSTLHTFNRTLSLIPSPPLGSLALQFKLNKHLLLLSGLSQDYPRSDTHLFWPFFSFRTEEVLRILGYILTQQNLLFVSSKYNLLAYTMESFCHYLFPFQWRLTYAPFLPKKLLGILQSPTAFLCGCHTSSMNEIDQDEIENMIIVTLDDGSISSTKDFIIDQNNLSIPSYFTRKYSHSIESLFKRRCLSFHILNEPTLGDLLLEKLRLIGWERDTDHKLSDIIMSMFADIFQDISSYVSYPSEFNRDGFLRSCNQEFRPFFEVITQTDVFNQLIKQLLNKAKTPFTKALDEFKKKRSSVVIPPLITGDPMSSFICISTTAGGIVQTEYVAAQQLLNDSDTSSDTTKQPNITLLELAEFPGPGIGSNHDYFQACVRKINAYLDSSSAPQCRAECIYLRAYYLLALGEPLNAMEDFISHLSKINVNLVPSEESLTEIFLNMSEENKSALRKMPYFSKSIFEMEHDISLSRRISNARFPIQSLTRDDFELYLQTNGISANSDTCTIIFSVLTNGGTMIAPESLKMFVECWSKVKKCNLSLQHNPAIDIPTKENIVFCSSDQPQHIVRYHNSHGRLLITDHNVWLLQADYKLAHLFKFTNVSSFSFSEIKKKGCAIKIQPTVEVEDLKAIKQLPFDKISSRKSVYHSIKFFDKITCVFAIECFKEMHAAHMLVQRRKDDSYLGEGKLNVLLLATLRRMSLKTLNSECELDLISQAIKQGLLYLFKTNVESRGIYDDHLLYRFNPLSTDTQKASIEVLLSVSSACQAQIFWIGYVYQGQSIICIYDYSNRSVLSDFILPDQRVEGIVEVGPKVWISSLNKSLYIVNKESYTIDGRLSEPNEVALVFHYEPLQNEVWVLYHKGQIVVWDTHSLEQKRTILLQSKHQESARYSYSSMTISQDYIFTLYSRSLIVFEKDLGGLITSLPLSSNSLETPMEARCICISKKHQVWVPCNREPKVCVFDSIRLILVEVLNVLDYSSDVSCNGFNSILSVGNDIWLGGRNGYIYIYDNIDRSPKSYFKGHEDSIRSLIVNKTQSIVTSGSNSKDGRVSFWST